MKIRPLNILEQLLDILMIPIMYVLSGTLKEKPQQTHKWNNTKFKLETLDKNKIVVVEGFDTTSKKRGTRFHTPIIGGWKKYVVLSPAQSHNIWHVGWNTNKVSGISRIPLDGPVRLLISPEDTSFFGMTPLGEQITIKQIGKGVIGEGGHYSQTTLL